MHSFPGRSAASDAGTAAVEELWARSGSCADINHDAIEFGRPRKVLPGIGIGGSGRAPGGISVTRPKDALVTRFRQATALAKL